MAQKVEGKKNIEEKSIINDNEIDLSNNEEMVEISLGKHKEERPKQSRKRITQDDDFGNETISCLRNERVIVRFVPRPTSIPNTNHVLYGGLAENATVSYVVPRLTTGVFKNILTDSEKDFLEKAMGLEYNALSIYKKQDNFWDDSNSFGIGRVTLHKQDNYLDLRNPEDYIKYKILLANNDEIAGSLMELEDHPKATYRFVIISEESESSMKSKNMSVTMQCYKEYGKIEDDADTLRVLIELLDGRPVSPKTKLDYLQSKVNDHIQAKPKLFLSAIKDPLLPMKVLIKKSVEAGLIGKKNDYYFLRADNKPLCEMNEESTLNNAARYLSSPKHQELMFMLQAKTKNS